MNGCRAASDGARQTSVTRSLVVGLTQEQAEQIHADQQLAPVLVFAVIVV